MENRRVFVRILVVLVFTAVLFAWPATSAVPAADPPAASEVANSDVKPSMVARAVQDALGGQFTKSQEDLRKAVQDKPDDKTLSAALKLVEAYNTDAAKSETERKAELADAARRVEQAMLAQSHQPKLAQDGLDKKLREKLQEAVNEYNNASTTESLEGAHADDIQQAKTKTVAALDKSLKATRQAGELLAKDDSPFAKTFQPLAQRAVRLEQDLLKAWKDLKGADAAETRKLKDIEEEATLSLADVETMVNENPWRTAMYQARLAKQMARPQDNLADQDWYKAIVSDTKARAVKAEADAKWYDAMMAYAALADLEDTNEQIKDKLKIVQRHVRVLGLYGKREESASKPATSGPKSKSGPKGQDDESVEEAEPHWKDLVEGVDADMVEKAITQMDGYYVTTVDYRKVCRGALTSVRVLVETPQASYSFPTLGDQTKKTAFLSAIEGQLETVEKRDRVDHLDLVLALNSVLRANERTVQIPTEVLVVEFTDGFLDELDKFSSMIWPYDLDAFRKQTMGNFSGIGVQIMKEPGEPLKVVTPLPDSPAFRAGIKTGDYIVKVDGKPTEKLPVDKLVRMITGEKGTKVTLTIKRQAKLVDYAIERAEITIRTIKGWRQKADGEWDFFIDPEHTVGYIRMTQFTDQTPRDMTEAITQLRKAGMRSLVLDLRFNPGGLLPAATMVADEFLKSGKIVSTQGRQTRHNEISAQDSGVYLEGDLVVLINNQSASAAEIVSGALKDWRRAIIIGQRTFGKGSVQNVIPIRKQALLKLTTAYYYLPSGRLLHRRNGEKEWGVDPDIDVLVTPRQIRRWLEIRRKTDLLQDVDPQELSDDLAAQFQADLQLNTAVVLLKMMQLQDSKLASAAR